MIDRYSSPQMTAIFSDEGRYARWREVELAVLDGYAAVAGLDEKVAAAARTFPAPTPEAVAERERLVGHDVVAFLIEWTSTMPDGTAAVVHRGLTSSDIVDTALALQIREADELILAAADRLVTTLAEHALTHRDSVRVGRTHGQHASLDSWGHRVADLALAADRARRQLASAGRDIAVGKLSGPTGAYHHIPPEVEAHACELLGLAPTEIATQVIMRDRLAGWMFALARCATVCEAVAMEVRLSQRPEVGELFEGPSTTRAGSSSMPHKANPITSENICGLAKMIRAYVNPVLEGTALWHERDLTHSSVERIAVPDAAALTEHTVKNTVSLVKNLIVDTDRMATTARDAAAGAALSSAALVRLCEFGMPWNSARELVQAASRADSHGSLAERIRDQLNDRPDLQRAWTDNVPTAAPPQVSTAFANLKRLVEGPPPP